MEPITLYLTGNQIGTYTGISSNGNNEGIKVYLDGVAPLGDATEVFRVVIRQTNGQSEFRNGQFVDIYTWSPTDTVGTLLYSSLNPRDDEFQGRASSTEHNIFRIDQDTGIVIDLNGISSTELRYGPGGLDLPRNGRLPFDAFPSTPPHVPCFVAGTMIDTASGPRAIETLRPGDLVRTLDHGLQPLRWIGTRTVSGMGHFAPVRIAASALGNDDDLQVSQQHRMLLRGWRAELMTGAAEVFVAAKHLVNGDTIRLNPAPTVTYTHIAFDAHEIVLAAGIPSESLFLGPVALDALGPAARGELLAIFPELAHRHWHAETARPCLRAWETGLVLH